LPAGSSGGASRSERSAAGPVGVTYCVGVTADTRGKRLSPDAIVPYAHEAADTYEVIDWIAHQPWSNGQVAMRGGS